MRRWSYHDDVGDEGMVARESSRTSGRRSCRPPSDEFFLRPVMVSWPNAIRLMWNHLPSGASLGGLLGQVVVAGHDGLATHEDFASWRS